MHPNSIIYDREQACSDIGQALHDAKRRMLDSFKKGVPLSAAAETFTAEASNVITKVQAKLDTLPAQDTKDRQLPPEALDNSDATPLYSSAEDFSLLEQRIETYLEDSIYIDGSTSTPKRQQRALVMLFDSLANAPRNDLYELIVFARDFAIKNTPELSEEVAAKLCGREIEVPRHSADHVERGDATPPPSKHPYDSTPETIAEFMAERPEWERALLVARARLGSKDRNREHALRIAIGMAQETLFMDYTDHGDLGAAFRRFSNTINDVVEAQQLRDESAFQKLTIGAQESDHAIDLLVSTLIEEMGDHEDGELALLELLTHFAPHDRSGFVQKARMSFLKHCTALAARAVDALVAQEIQK